MTLQKPIILVVEDESAIRDMLRYALEPAGFTIVEAENILSAQQQLTKIKPALILLDWMLPGGSGMQYIRQLKTDKNTEMIPVMMLTAKAEEFNKVSGLEGGADDYITKPFSPRELIARIKNVLRRGVVVNVNEKITFEELTLDVNTHQVIVQGQALVLTPVEFRLLHFFLTHRGRVYSREQLLNALYPHELDVELRTIDTQVRRLRDRLRPFGCAHWVQTVRGAGYRFDRKSL